MQDLCVEQEQLEKKFRSGEIYEEILEISEDAELFHLERKDQESIVIARTWCRPIAFGSSTVKDEVGV